MKYFVIHSGENFAEAEKLTKLWSQTIEKAQFILLNGQQEDWKADATARIRECNKVIYFVGQHSANSENIQYEIDTALAEHKEIYIYKLDPQNVVNEKLTKNDSFRKDGAIHGEIVIGKNKQKVRLLSKDEILQAIASDCIAIESELRGREFDNKDILMQQYAMFVQTSEELVRRKQTVNSFYITLNSILLGALVSTLGVTSEMFISVNVEIIGYSISMLMAIIGIVVCCSWITLLSSYSDLNASKMAIISCIEEYLALKLFDTEWTLLTRRIGKKRYKSFTVKEIAVARIFVILYSAILLIPCGYHLYTLLLPR